MSNTGAIGGAAQGAAQGFAVAGPWGALVGGVVGGIGGMFSDKSARHARKADKFKEEARLIQSFLERRALIQQYQIARSSIMAQGLAAGAGTESSGIIGAQASVRSQTVSNLRFNAAQIVLERKAGRHMRASGKAAQNAGAIGGLLNAGSAIVDSSGLFNNSGYNASAQQAGTGSYTGTGSTVLSAPPIAMPTTINTGPFSRPNG